MMDEPIHSDRSVAGVGPAASFAKLWLDDHPNESIGLIPCADGGTSIDDWNQKVYLLDMLLLKRNLHKKRVKLLAYYGIKVRAIV